MTEPLPRWARLCTALWIAGFLVGTTTHVVDLALAGREVYAGFPAGVRLFWVSLTALDPAVVALLALRRRAAVLLGVAIMVVDVSVNWTVHATTPGTGAVGVLLQSAFCVVVLATARPLWRVLRRRPASVTDATMGG